MRSTLRRLVAKFFGTYPGCLAAETMVRALSASVFSNRTASSASFDVARLKASRKMRRISPQSPLRKLHIGCGRREVDGFINADIRSETYPLDLCQARLPWLDESFDVVVGQHVIEHLDLDAELLPLLRELRRICTKGAEVWLSTPDLQKVCSGYCQDSGESLLEDKISRWGDSPINGAPTQHVINYFFHQSGEHKNLFDFAFLSWAVGQCGFGSCVRVDESQFIERFPTFPHRGDDFHSLYVRAEAE